MRIAAHQPNLCPWLPFFRKVQSVDRFVILTHCQYEKNGYQNRFLVSDRWLTLAVQRGLDPIWMKHYVDAVADWEHNKQFVGDYANELSLFDDCIGPSLAETNTKIIRRAAATLGIRTEIVMDYPTPLRSTGRLVDICRRHGATHYLSGISGKKYLDMTQFDAAGIVVEFQEIVEGDKISLVEAIRHARLHG